MAVFAARTVQGARKARRPVIVQKHSALDVTTRREGALLKKEHNPEVSAVSGVSEVSGVSGVSGVSEVSGVSGVSEVSVISRTPPKLRRPRSTFRLRGPRGRRHIISATPMPLSEVDMERDESFRISNPGEIPWPKSLPKTFVISIRDERWKAICARFGPWKRYLNLFRGTSGYGIKRLDYAREGKIGRMNAKLTRGMMGCYDSHVRLWRMIVEKDLDRAFIMEDDAAIYYSEKHAFTIESKLKELEKSRVPYDVCYIGHANENKATKFSPNLSRPKGWRGLFAYVITKEGAKKILNSRYHPMTVPIDIYLTKVPTLQRVCFEPPLCYVVPVHSDTCHIR